VYTADRLVATLGLEDTVVIDAPDALLVCPKDRSDDIRPLLEALAAGGVEELTLPRTSTRPWGSWTTVLRGEGFQVKLLEIKPGGRPSLQRHRHRSEHWIVVCGQATVTRDDEVLVLGERESTFIPVGAAHRIENTGGEMLQVVEVQSGEYLGEDDIVRIEDDWNRGDV
jgi:mannose-1-phosphate guanylyltransferase/mannose-6-phosphate isomerase